MNINAFSQLRDEGRITDATFQKIKQSGDKNILSVYWEIKTLLYLGITLLCTGLGILVYENINTIGHQVILLFIALLCAACFYYCLRNTLPFTTTKVAAPNAFFDYILLLGCSTFIVLIAYLQYQYQLFGNRYGLATFIPMVLLFCSAYYFDHAGILSIAIINLGAWLGITITPLQVLESNDFNSSRVIFTGLGLGLLLMLMAFASTKNDFKKHFEFTYANFGTHILLISCLAAVFHFNGTYFVWFLLLMGTVYFLYKKALRERSFYFLLIITLYAYIGISYLVLNLLGRMSNNDLAPMYLGFFYFIMSGIGLVIFLMRTNKKLKKDDSIQSGLA